MDAEVRSAGGRRQPEPARIAARVARLLVPARGAQGVMPLNPGFFALEAMRAGNVAKKRGATKRRVK